MACSGLKHKQIAVLIATRPRPGCLLATSLPSIVAQTRQADVVVIVADRQPLSKLDVARMKLLLAGVQLVVLNNKNLQGAAGSWNTGIDYLTRYNPSCFVAVLDDDDYWDKQHLAKCEQLSENAQVVVSGINVVDGNQVRASNVPEKLSSEDFLVGNPGWQGSNTFISLELLNRAGRFSSGLVSCNDRDLAIRVLDLQPSIKFTNQATVFWTINHRVDALSAKRSPQKLAGVCQFYSKYRQRMTYKQKDKFFNRIEQLFEWTRDEIEAELRTREIETKTSAHLSQIGIDKPQY